MSNDSCLTVKLLDPGARVPRRTRASDAGYDLSALAGFELAAGERQVIATGIALALPAGTCGLVLPRSGLAARHGVTIVNAPGLIDPSYRGEVAVVLLNTSAEVFHARAGDRIAQLLVVSFSAPELAVVDELPASDDGRGADGFGSSGR